MMDFIKNIFDRFPYLQNEKVFLCEPLRSEYKKLQTLFNSSDTQRYQSSYNFSDLEMFNYVGSLDSEFRKKRKILWVIKSKEVIVDRNFEIIGIRVLYCDDNSGYVEIQGDTFKTYWRKGYTKSAYQLIIDFLKQNGGKGIVANIQPSNISAIKLVESLGFKFDKGFLNEYDVEQMRYILEFSSLH